MPTLTITIHNGETKVVADGSKLSCDTAHDVEKAIGKVTKSTPTAKVTTGTITQQR
jgi:hypothetical protein